MYKKNILAIHLNTQVIKGFLAILLILTGLIFSSRLVGYFEQAAAGSLNPNIIFSVMKYFALRSHKNLWKSPDSRFSE